MAKIGNYFQRDYSKRFGSNRKPTLADYNKAWMKRRQMAAKRIDQLNNLAYVMQSINTQASQANTLFVMQNQGRLGTYASQTAAMARINVVV
ncbi:flagellar biosynthesis protein [Roseibium sp. LAB1]